MELSILLFRDGKFKVFAVVFDGRADLICGMAGAVYFLYVSFASITDNLILSSACSLF